MLTFSRLFSSKNALECWKVRVLSHHLPAADAVFPHSRAKHGDLVCAPHAVAARGRTVVCGTPPVSSAAGHVKGGGGREIFRVGVRGRCFVWCVKSERRRPFLFPPWAALRGMRPRVDRYPTTRPSTRPSRLCSTAATARGRHRLPPARGLVPSSRRSFVR